MKRLAAFTVVGGAGFCVDAGILTLLVNGLGWSHYAARALSFSAAVTVTWYFNRQLVFQRTADARKEYRAYVTTQLIGAFINLGTFSLLIETIPVLARLPVVPLAVGAVPALMWNYLAARHWVYGGRTRRRQVGIK